jgi:RNA polymerase sigma factor (sigma-70 family)
MTSTSVSSGGQRTGVREPATVPATTATATGTVCGAERARPPRRPHVDLPRLVERAAAGDREAFAQLVAAHRSLVTHVARRYVSRSADADDVAQEVWIKLWEHLDTIERPEALPGWLRRVTTNVAFRLQARGARVVVGEVDDLPSTELTEDLGLRRTLLGDVRVAVEGALGRLKASDRRLVELLMIEDRPDYRAVSRQINRPVGSIGPTRQRIFERLRHDPDIGRLARTGEPAPISAIAIG